MAAAYMFSLLPNLPKAVVPTIDLGIERSVALSIEPSVHRKIGFFITDQAVQTERSDVLELKKVTRAIETLKEEIEEAHKDLDYTRHVLKVDYEARLDKRATELYCEVNDKMKELQRAHEMKIDVLRKSFQAKLSNAVSRINGEYKSYYEDVVRGKSGAQEKKARELRQRVAQQEQEIKEQKQIIEDLNSQLSALQSSAQAGEGESPTPLPEAVPMEMVEGLRGTVSLLEQELGQARAELAGKEDINSILSKQVDYLNKQLEAELAKVQELKKELENFRKKAKLQQEQASRLAENQLASMQKEMKGKLLVAEKEAAMKAEQQAELRKMKDLQEQLTRQEREERMRMMNRPSRQTLSKDDARATIERLERLGEQQREEIQRLTSELERANRMWEMKLAVMQKNFHALRDECFVRTNLQRQAAMLRHAAVGYAVCTEPSPKVYSGKMRPLPKIRPPSTREGAYHSPTDPLSPTDNHNDPQLML